MKHLVLIPTEKIIARLQYENPWWINNKVPSAIYAYNVGANMVNLIPLHFTEGWAKESRRAGAAEYVTKVERTIKACAARTKFFIKH